MRLKIPHFAGLVLICQVLFPVLSLSQCVTVTHPNPSGGTIDLVDWMTMDASLRSSYHLDGSHILGSVAFGDKIIWTKFSLAGDNWDQWAFDNDFVYWFITGTPTTFWAPPYQTAVPYAPRYPQLGWPGTRLVLTCNQWVDVTNCVKSEVHPGANLVEEVSGPFTVDLGGNIHSVSVVVVDYYWDCSGTTPASCTQLESNWYAKPYGWVQWTYYNQVNGNWVWRQTSTFNSLVAGASNYQTWCF
jgi:hypothetical protein